MAGRSRGCSSLLAYFSGFAWWGVVLGFLSALGAPADEVAAQEALRVDTTRSYFVAVTGRAGALGFLGHEHGVLATDYEAEVVYDPDAPGNSSIAVEVVSAALVIDSEEARRRGRLDNGPAEDEIPGIQADMLGAEVLNAVDHPQITFRSTEIVPGEGNRLALRGEVSMVGTTVPVETEVTVRAIEEFTLFTTEVELRLSDFGVVPPSVGSVVKVADEFTLRVALWTLPAN